jgi:ribonuclease HIII
MASNYWQTRAAESDKIRRGLEDLGVNDAKQISDSMASQIQSEIDNYYRKYAENVVNDKNLTLNQFFED